jgi:hypothetical protein
MSYSGDEIKARGADFTWLVSAEEKAATYRAAVKKRLYNAIHTAFPEFRSVFEDADQAYIALSELGSYVVFNIHQAPLRVRFFEFVNAEYAQADEETRYFFDVGPLEEWLPPFPHRYFGFSLQQLALQHLQGAALTSFARLAAAYNAALGCSPGS